MNASLALCAAVLSALPTAGTAPGRSSVYDAGQSERFAAVIRGQAPMTDMPAPTFSPAPQGMIYGGAPGPVVGQGAPIYGDPYGAAPIGPDPFLGSDPGYMPGGGFPEGRWGWYVGYDNMFIIRSSTRIRMRSTSLAFPSRSRTPIGAMSTRPGSG